MRMKTLTGAALALALTLAPMSPLSAKPPAKDTAVDVAVSAAIICDTSEQVTSIARASIDVGPEAAAAIVRSLYQARNKYGERRCVVQPVYGRLVAGESVYVGHRLAAGAIRRYWAVQIRDASGRAFWMLWSEALPKAAPVDA